VTARSQKSRIAPVRRLVVESHLSRPRQIAWWVLVTVSVIGGLSLPAALPEMQNPFLYVPLVPEVVIGALITRRRPENAIGWVFLGIGAVGGLLTLGVALTAMAARAPDPIPWWGVLGVWLGEWTWPPLLYLLTTATLLLFPSGLPSRRWRPVLWLSLASVGAVTLLSATSSRLPTEWDAAGNVTQTIANPFSAGFLGAPALSSDTAILPVLTIVFLLTGLAGAAAAVLRTRRAEGLERLQMRWFGLAASVLLAEVLFEVLVGTVFTSLSGSLALNLAEAVAIGFFPVACGIAILRYRLYDIDRIISRSASYALVTAAVVALYVGVVTAVGRILPSSDSLAVAAATLAAAAAFRPALTRVRTRLDRHFDRTAYDSLRTADEFGARLSTAVDSRQISEDLLQLVRITLTPEHASLWTRQP
jgi:hypothetical protein